MARERGEGAHAHTTPSRENGRNGCNGVTAASRLLRRPLRLPTPSEHVLLLRDGLATTHQRGVYAHTDGRTAWWTGVRT